MSERERVDEGRLRLRPVWRTGEVLVRNRGVPPQSHGSHRSAKSQDQTLYSFRILIDQPLRTWFHETKKKVEETGNEENYKLFKVVRPQLGARESVNPRIIKGGELRSSIKRVLLCGINREREG